MRPPIWFIIIIIIFLLPVFSFPKLLSLVAPGDDGALTFVWIYPFYMLLSAWLAYSAYRTRTYISVILLLLMALSTAAIWLVAPAGDPTYPQ